MICVTVSKDGAILRSYAVDSSLSEQIDLAGLVNLLDCELVGHIMVKNDVFTAGAFDGEPVSECSCD